VVTVWLERWLQCGWSLVTVVTAWLVWLQYGWSVDVVWLELRVVTARLQID